jgi:hypothetical protein
MKQFDIDNDPKISSGFNIPEDYFEKFENKVMDKISLMKQLPEEEAKVIPIFKTRKFWFYAVAAVLVLSISITLYFSNTKTDYLTTEDYLAYDTNCTTEDIAEQLTDDDIVAIEKSLNLYDQETTNYANDYL